MSAAFNDDLRQRIDAICARYPATERAAALIPVLQLAQEAHGYLTLPILSEVAQLLAVPPAKVLQTATFYTMLRNHPVGRYHIQVCTNVSCWLRESDQILARLKQLLDLEVGETTPDGLFTLSTVECLGACGTAPVVQVNDTYHEGMTVAAIDALVARLRAEAAPAEGA